MEVLSDDYWFSGNGASIDVMDVEKSCLVTYRTANGQPFRLVFRVKPNPIGFTAKF